MSGRVASTPDVEWKELEMFLGMTQFEADGIRSRGMDEGGKLK